MRVANQDMVGGALEKATELLQQMQESIRLRIGRPDASSSVVVVQDGEEVNQGNNIIISNYNCFVPQIQCNCWRYILSLEYHKL